MKRKEFDMKAHYEGLIHDRLQALEEVADYLQSIDDLQLWKSEARTFEEYCKKWGLNPTRIKIILSMPQLFQDIKGLANPHTFLEPELAKEFKWVDNDERFRLAQRTVIKNKTITPELIRETMTELSPLE